jgi:hypothetical protein
MANVKQLSIEKSIRTRGQRAHKKLRKSVKDWAVERYHKIYNTCIGELSKREKVINYDEPLAF